MPRTHTANLALYKQTVLKASEEFAASGRALPSRTVVLELDRNPSKLSGGCGVGARSHHCALQAHNCFFLVVKICRNLGRRCGCTGG